MKNYAAIISGLIILFSAQTSLADDCQLEITGNDMLQFDQVELSVPAICEEVTLTLKHIGSLPAISMGHNWVLTETGNMAAIANDGISAGLDNNYLKANDSRILAATDIIGGGEETSISFNLAGLVTGKDYAYFCSFPGHWAIMQGVFNITE